jgi:hypothetical protein
VSDDVKVICDKSVTCPEPYCGARQPHWPEPNECGKCPRDKSQKCIPAAEEQTIKESQPEVKPKNYPETSWTSVLHDDFGL